MQVWEKSGGISGELEEKSNDGSQGEFRGFQCPVQSELLWQKMASFLGDEKRGTYKANGAESETWAQHVRNT